MLASPVFREILPDMKRVIGAAIAVVAVGLVGVTVQSRREAQQSGQESKHASEELRARTAEVADLRGQLENARRQVEQLRSEVGDLPRLRGEVTQLRQQLAQASNAVERARTSQARLDEQLRLARETREAGERAGAVVEPEVSHAPIRFADLPAHVQAAVATRYPGIPFAEVVRQQEDGRTFYQLEGLDANRREIGALYSAEGELLRQSRQMEWDGLPEPVRNTLASQAGLSGPANFREIWNDDGITYRGWIDHEGREASFAITPEGRLIQYEVELAR